MIFEGNFLEGGGCAIKRFIGVIVAIVLVIIACTFFHGVVKYLVSIFGIYVGVLVTVIIECVANKKNMYLIVLLLFIGASVFSVRGLVYLVMVEVHDFLAIDHTLDLSNYVSYTFDSRSIVEESVPFPYAVQLTTGNISKVRRNLLRIYDFELPDDLFEKIISSDDNYAIILSFHSRLTELKYHFLGYFSDGRTAKMALTFDEDRQNNVVYVYFLNRDLYFWEADYYIMRDKSRVLLDERVDMRG